MATQHEPCIIQKRRYIIKSKPFLKWPGNKFRCVHQIIPHLPEGNRLIEPFAGAAALFMNTNYQQYLLADINNDLINIFSLLQQEGELFIRYCQRFFTPAHNCAEIYYQFRAEFNQCTAPRRRAALFLYLNRHGFNGLCRYNQSGKFNVPFGQHVKPYFPIIEMIHFHKKSAGVTLLTSDFEATFAKSQPGDIIYCDPPYVPLTASANFSAYSAQAFGEKEQLRLAQLAVEYSKNKRYVVISNHDTDLTREYYKRSRIISFPVMRSISCKASGRKMVQELLAVFG